MSRGGVPRTQPPGMRTCVGCRAVRPRQVLARLVVGPGGLQRDERRRQPGRGAWVCVQETCCRRAARQLARALRAPGLSVGADELWSLVAGRGT